MIDINNIFSEQEKLDYIKAQGYKPEDKQIVRGDYIFNQHGYEKDGEFIEIDKQALFNVLISLRLKTILLDDGIKREIFNP